MIVEGGDDISRTQLHRDRLLDVLAEALPSKQAAAIAAKVTGEKKNALYQAILERRNSN